MNAIHTEPDPAIRRGREGRHPMTTRKQQTAARATEMDAHGLRDVPLPARPHLRPVRPVAAGARAAVALSVPSVPSVPSGRGVPVASAEASLSSAVVQLPLRFTPALTALPPLERDAAHLPPSNRRPARNRRQAPTVRECFGELRAM